MRRCGGRRRPNARPRGRTSPSDKQVRRPRVKTTLFLLSLYRIDYRMIVVYYSNFIPHFRICCEYVYVTTTVRHQLYQFPSNPTHTHTRRAHLPLPHLRLSPTTTLITLLPPSVTLLHSIHTQLTRITFFRPPPRPVVVRPRQSTWRAPHWAVVWCSPPMSASAPRTPCARAWRRPECTTASR